jgi:hypothetical protein
MESPIELVRSIESLLVELYDFARDPNTVLSGPRIIETWAHRPAI